MTLAISDTTLWDKINNAFGSRGGSIKLLQSKMKHPLQLADFSVQTQVVFYILEKQLAILTE